MINYFSESKDECLKGWGQVYIIAMAPVKLHTHLPNKNHSFDACSSHEAFVATGLSSKFCNLSAKSGDLTVI